MKRFWDKVDKTPGQGPEGTCWKWTGFINRYGRFGFRGTVWLAHRVAWILAKKGEIPPGLCICHSCDNPWCVNPAHLFLGSHADNMADMSRKGRQSRRDGEENHGAKLTEVKVREIRARDARGGVSQRQLAKEYGVHQTLISLIINRKSWEHVL